MDDKEDREEIISYRCFDEMVNRLANWLLSRGVGKGDFVLTHLPNSPGFLVASHACTKIGAIFIPSIIFDRPCECVSAMVYLCSSVEIIPEIITYVS